MHQLLNPKEIVSADGVKIRVAKFLGGGTQGEVYQGDVDGHPVAVKWYFPRYLRSDSGMRARLLRAVSAGPPDPRFLWPQAIVTSETRSGFGYLMELRDPNYKSILDLVIGRADPTFSALVRAGFNLADGFLQLHARGLCYRDISFGNLFFNPSTGNILICDNDNVDIDGQDGAIGGTPDFMAPEIVVGEAKPSTKSDLHSLAVLLFYMFFIHHPLQGKALLSIRALDLPARRQLCGSNPVYIFDPVNKSNEAVPAPDNEPNLTEGGANALLFWPIYPDLLKSKFEEAFTLGLKDPSKRVVESVWRQTMLRLLDSIVDCPACGKENFFDESRLQDGNYVANCWSCKAGLPLPMRMVVNGWVIPLTSGKTLHHHHVAAFASPSLNQPVGEVVTHPTDKRVMGLKNMSDDKWVVTLIGKEPQDVLPNQSIRLEPGALVSFGNGQGQVIM